MEKEETFRVMLICALRAQDKEFKSWNIPSNFVHSIYYKFKIKLNAHIPTKIYYVGFLILCLKGTC